MFSTEAMKTSNIVFYDIPRQIRSGQYAQAARNIVSTAIAGMLLRMMAQGFPTGGDDDNPKDDETWTEWMFAAVMEGFVGQTPVVGTEIMNAIDGKHYSDDHTIVTEPFWKMWNGVRKIAEDDGDDTARDRLMRSGMSKSEYGTLSMLQGLSLLAGAPYSQARRVWLSGDARDAWDVLMVNMGNRRAMERTQQALREKRLANW